MGKGKRRAVFLDRDGTAIHDTGYLKDPKQVQLIPGAGEALVRLGELGFLLVLVSNQSGIGRGWITQEQAEQVHLRFVSCLADYGVQLDSVYYCPHAPGDRCSCRKPSPEMLLRAAEALDIDLDRSFMIGDKSSDIEAGKRAGCCTLLLGSDSTSKAMGSTPDHTARDWTEASRYILNSMGTDT